MNDQDKRIKELEARVAQLEGPKCRICNPLEPITFTTFAHILEFKVDHATTSLNTGRFAILTTVWGDLRLPIDEKTYKNLWERMTLNQGASLKIEFK